MPACGQCILRNLPCGGYPKNYIILTKNKKQVVESTNNWKHGAITWANEKQSDLQVRPISKPHRAPKGALIFITLSAQREIVNLEDDVRFIVEQYSSVGSDLAAESNPWHNQVCGVWVEALPMLLAKGPLPDFLAAAIQCFAAALSHYCVGSSGNHPRVLELYGEALALVATALQKISGVLQAEHCAAIMCLAVTEVSGRSQVSPAPRQIRLTKRVKIVFPSSESSWLKHVAAVGDFVERLGPAAFTTGVLHRLFVGFRPLLVSIPNAS